MKFWLKTEDLHSIQSANHPLFLLLILLIIDPS